MPALLIFGYQPSVGVRADNAAANSLIQIARTSRMCHISLLMESDPDCFPLGKALGPPSHVPQYDPHQNRERCERNCECDSIRSVGTPVSQSAQQGTADGRRTKQRQVSFR